MNLCSVLTLGAEVRRKLVIKALDASTRFTLQLAETCISVGDSGFLPLPSARYLGSSQYTPCRCWDTAGTGTFSGGAGLRLEGPGVDAAGVTLSRCGGGGIELGTDGDIVGCVWELGLARTVMQSLGGDLERLVPTESGFSGVRGATTELGARLPIGSEVGATGGGGDTTMGDGGETTF